jgi:hypothetical protein
MPVKLSPLVRITLVIGAVAFLLPGMWAFLAPVGFADTIATFEPYNRHYLHDLGAFQIGVGTAALVAVWVYDGAVVGLSGLLAGDSVHAISHIVDRDLGGRSADAPLIALVAVLALVALISRVRALRRTPTTAGISARR